MKVSVIVPIYNVSAFLKKCLDSILSQDFDEYEVILVDDGSTDGSAEIADSYSALYKEKVTVIHQENHGAGHARNTGIERATAEYIVFIDSDDYVERDMLSCLYSLIQKYGAQSSACEMTVEYSDGTSYNRYCEPKELIWDTKQALVELNSYRYLYMSVCNAMFSRKLFDDLRFPQGINGEDYSIHYRLLAKCNKVVYTSRPLYHYIQRDGSSSRNQSVSLDLLAISKEQVAYFDRFYPEILYAAKTDCAFVHLAVYSAFVRNGLECPRDLYCKIRKEIVSDFKYIMINKSIPKIKKVQIIVFLTSPSLFNSVIRRKKHR